MISASPEATLTMLRKLPEAFHLKPLARLEAISINEPPTPKTSTPATSIVVLFADGEFSLNALEVIPMLGEVVSIPLLLLKITLSMFKSFQGVLAPPKFSVPFVSGTKSRGE